MAELTCPEARGHLPAYLAGEADAAVTAALEQHLAACADCRAMAARLRQTAQFYHTAPQPTLPPAARERLYRALDLGEFLTPPDTKRA